MKDKVEIITGASSGIGFELTKQLVDEGVLVAVCARNIQPLCDFFSEKELAASQFFVKSVDVVNEQEIIAFVTEVLAKFNSIDFLFNNVGVNTSKGEIFDIKTSDFDAMYAVNMRAPMVFTREVALQMKEQMSGTIINTHSTCCLFSNVSNGLYTATKSGFEALSQIFRKELRDFNIKTLNVYPGGVDTSFRAVDRPDYLRPQSVAATILQQLKLPSEVYMDDIVLRPQVERNF